MASQFADLQIGRIAVHEVFVRDHDHQVVSPSYSESLVLLNAAGLDAIRDRLIKAMGSDSKSIEMSIEDEEPASVFQASCPPAKPLPPRPDQRERSPVVNRKWSSSQKPSSSGCKHIVHAILLTDKRSSVTPSCVICRSNPHRNPLRWSGRSPRFHRSIDVSKRPRCDRTIQSVWLPRCTFRRHHDRTSGTIGTL
jgi:hypothetical protein